MPITPELSSKLLALKEKSGLTFEQIGEEVGTSDANARRYIKGETKIPDRQLLISIIRCLGGDPDQLLSEKPQQTDGIYDKIKAEYDRQIALCHSWHDKEINNLKQAAAETIRSKDELIAGLKADIADHKRIYNRLVVIMAIFIAILSVFVFAYLLRDITDPHWGYFRY